VSFESSEGWFLSEKWALEPLADRYEPSMTNAVAMRRMWGELMALAWLRSALPLALLVDGLFAGLGIE
jgi:hypothetical protein